MKSRYAKQKRMANSSSGFKGALFPAKFSPSKIRNMAGPVDVNRSLKEALYESLSAILSPEQSIRAGGEEQIKALEVTEGKLMIGIVAL